MDFLTAIYYFFISFVSGIIGTIGGVGSGIFVRPLLEMHGLTAYYASLFSSLAVFSMAITMAIKRARDIRANVQMGIAIPIAIGSIIGGFLGNIIFRQVEMIDRVALVTGQLIITMLVMGILLLHQVFKAKIKPLNWKGAPTFLTLGIVLGMIAAFLGIGGGPLNLSSLNFFAGMGLQGAAIYSVFIISFTQGANLLRWGIQGLIGYYGTWGWPVVSVYLILAVVIGSTVGSLIGTGIYGKIKASKKINSENVLRWVYISVLISVMILTAVNFFFFRG